MPRERATPRRLSTDERRAHLLEVGLDLFSTRSYDELSVGDIADAAGLSKGLLYHYFAGKREFYVAVVTESSQRLVDGTAPDDSLPADQRLLSALDRYLDYVESNAVGYAALMQGGLGADAEVAAVLEVSRWRFAERVLAQLPAGSETPALRLVLRGWVAYAETVAVQWVAHPTIDRDAVRDLLASGLAGLLTASGVAPLGAVLDPT